MKKILFLLLAVTLFCCCSSSDDSSENLLVGFEKYEGTWGPVSYTIKGVEYTCNPNSPSVNNINRFVFLKYSGEEIIMRTEYYSNGSWKQRSDKTLYWHNGSFYKSTTTGMGDPYTDIVLSDDVLQLKSDPGTKYKKVK